MQQNFSMSMEKYFQELVERAGAEFCGLRNGQVCFRGGPDEPICRLYPFALKSVEDVRLALKSAREKQRAAQWEFDSPAAKATHA
jgi:hypothetical protein